MSSGSEQKCTRGETELSWEYVLWQKVVFILFVIIPLLFGGFVLILMLISACRSRVGLDAVQHPETGYPFPTAAEIASIRIRSSTPWLDFEDFDAPVRHWPRMLAALSPSQRDLQPAGSQGLADLEIRTKDGGTISVDVYWLEDEPVGAFSVEAPPPHGGGYYRGGNSKHFMEALAAALVK